MNPENDPSGDKLERLLRHWGAEEAADQAEVGRLAPAAPHHKAVSWARRWLPAAAAVVLLASSVTLYLSSRHSQVAAQVAAEWESKIAEFDGALALNRAALAATERQLDEEKKLAQESLREQALQAAKAAVAQQESEKLAATLKSKETALTKAENELDGSRQQVTRLGADLATSRNQLAGLRKQFDLQAARWKNVQGGDTALAKQLEELRARHAATLALLEPPGPAVAGVARSDEDRYGRLAARQELVRELRLMERLPEMRDIAASDNTRQLLDRLEVVLTRLEMLQPSVRADAEAFAALVRSSNLVGQIEAALLEGSEPQAVRAWLVETELVLTEVRYVG